MSRKKRWIAGGAAALFLLFHLPYLPKSLEDVDSINFALGVDDFSVAHHQPHPPGYPVFIALAKGLHAAGASELHALSLLSVISGSLGVLAFLAFFTAIETRPAPNFRAYGATLLAGAAPLYWFTASRPLTDATGLAAALAVQALIVSAGSDRAIVVASFLAAFATGLRSQVAWLTVPLLVFAIARRARERKRRGGEGRSVFLPAFGAFVVGGFAWGMPLVMLAGGPGGYWRAVADQGNEDLTSIVMLWTTRTLQEARSSLYYAFVAPWAVPALAAAILLFAAVGLILALRRRLPELLTLAIAFGPYLFFDLVFQETITTRYALPLVAPIAYLAVCGAEIAGPALATVAVVVTAAFSMHIGGTSVAAYASEPAPSFRAIADMKSDASNVTAVVAMHRREDLDLRRPLRWAGSPAFAARLPAPPKHEWLEAVKYWNAGGRSPLWFVADPLRSDLALIGIRDTPHMYRWTLGYPILLGGSRPSEMDWHVIPPPDWYLGEGWAVTPETAGIAEEDGRGPGAAPIDGWVRRWPAHASVMVGGRNLTRGRARAHVRVAIDGRVVDEADVLPGFFLRLIDVPAGELSGPGDYAHVTVAADSKDVAIEQFDAQPASRVLVGYGEGWHEREYSPSTGRLWRWTSDRGVLNLVSGKQALVLTLEGEVEAASTARVTIRAGDRIVAAQDVGETFSIRQVIPKELISEGENTITISTDQSYVPAERRSRSQDHRLLGLKIYRCSLTPIS